MCSLPTLTSRGGATRCRGLRRRNGSCTELVNGNDWLAPTAADWAIPGVSFGPLHKGHDAEALTHAEHRVMTARWHCHVPPAEGAHLDVGAPKALDVLAMTDERWDGDGPANSGFIFVRSNCRTRALTRQLAAGAHVMFNTHVSQVFWNRMLTSSDVRVSMGLLPVQQFVNGANIRFGKTRMLWGGGPSVRIPPADWFVMHACWTNAHTAKQRMYKSMGALYDLQLTRWPDETRDASANASRPKMRRGLPGRRRRWAVVGGGGAAAVAAAATGRREGPR